MYPSFLKPLVPVASSINELTAGWTLSTADLSPETPTTPLGIAFLSTNLAFLIVGAILFSHGAPLLGVLAEVAGVVSYWYHYNQLDGNEKGVKLSLFIDYMTAGSAVILGTTYLIKETAAIQPLAKLFGAGGFPELYHTSPDFIFAVASGGLAVASLLLCWVWEYGLPYLVQHSVWHIMGAVSCFFVGMLKANML